MTDMTASAMTSNATGVGIGGSRLLAVGTALPDEVVTNDDLAALMDTDDGWIVTRTGIHERRRGGTTTSLATDAARQALDRSGLDPDLVDLVIVATQTPDDLCPSTAAGSNTASASPAVPTTSTPPVRGSPMVSSPPRQW